MKEIKGYLIGAVIIICLLAALFFAGYRYYPVKNPPPVPDIDTVLVYDTVTHLIRDTVPYYIVRRDSVIKWREVPAFVDTVAILADYFAIHYYSRTWEDSLLFAQADDAVSENQFVDNYFTYRIKRSQSKIYNDYSVNYSKYLNIGVSLPISKMEYAEIEALFAFRRGHIGIGYIPSIKSGSLNIGINLLQFK